MASDESADTIPGQSTARSFRTALADVAGDPELRAYYAAVLGLFAVVELYERAVPLLAADVGVSAAALGVGFGAARAAEIAVSPISGVVADERDRAAVAAAAAVGLAAALALFPLVGGGAPFPLVGAGALLVALMAAVAVARLFLTNSVTPAIGAALTEDREGIGWAVRDVGLYVGSALGLAAGGALVARFGVVAVFPVAAPAALGVAAATWRASDGGRPALVRPSAWRSAAGRWRSAGAGVRSLASSLRSVPAWLGRAASPLRDLLSPGALPRPRVLARLCVVEAGVSLGGGMSLFLLPLLAVEVGLTGEAFLALLAGAHVAAAPLSLLGGAAADRHSRKRLYVGNYLAETLMLLAFGLAGVGVLVGGGGGRFVAGGQMLPAVGGRALFVVGLALFVVQTAFEPAVLAYFFDQFADERAATAWSVEGAVSKAAGVVAPVVVGVLFAADPRLPFLAGAGLLATGTAVALTLPKGRVAG